jgi:hypothetical protein
VADFLLFQVERDSVDVFPYSKRGVLMYQGRLFFSHLLCQSIFQVIQLLREARVEFVQKVLLPSSKGLLCAEEVIYLLDHLMEVRDFLSILNLVAIKLLPGKSKVISVL